MLGKFPYDIVSFVERVGQCSAVFPTVVFETIGSITVDKPMRVEVGGSHAA